MMINCCNLECFKMEWQLVKSIMQTLFYRKIITDMALLLVQHSYILIFSNLNFMATREFLSSFDRYFRFTNLSSIVSVSPVLISRTSTSLLLASSSSSSSMLNSGGGYGLEFVQKIVSAKQSVRLLLVALWKVFYESLSRISLGNIKPSADKNCPSVRNC